MIMRIAVIVRQDNKKCVLERRTLSIPVRELSMYVNYLAAKFLIRWFGRLLVGAISRVFEF